MAKEMHKSGQNVLQAKGHTGRGSEWVEGAVLEGETVLQLTLLLLKITKIMLNR